MHRLDSSSVQSALGLSDRCTAWLDRIPTPDQASTSELPTDAGAGQILSQWGAEPVAIQACLAGRPSPDQHPHLWWVLRHAHYEVVVNMGRKLEGDEYSGWPELPDELGPVGKYLYAWVFLAAYGETLRFHRERNIPEDVSLATFGMLGRHLTIWSEGGENATWMLPLVLRGVSYHLGRHDFDRYGSVLNVHIPGNEPLDSTVSLASFEWAREFFPRHFPEDRVTSFVCYSWLMDDQWARYLPASSNILQFQRRFTLTADRDPKRGDNDILRYVFGRQSDGPSPSAEILDTLPQHTTLQRAYVHHLRQGRHWWTLNGSAPF